MRIIELLSGLEKILNAILQMRNKGGDGLDEQRISIYGHYVRLFVNRAKAMADFFVGGAKYTE